MTVSIFDERGELLTQIDSDIQAIAFALQRQRTGKLTTILLDGDAEIMFAPTLDYGKRAKTALEYKMRAAREAADEMSKQPTFLQRLLPSK